MVICFGESGNLNLLVFCDIGLNLNNLILLLATILATTMHQHFYFLSLIWGQSTDLKYANSFHCITIH